MREIGSGLPLLLGLAMVVPGSAFAAPCPLPNAISNGQVADATKVMENFDALEECAENAVTPTGVPTTGSIAVFSGAVSVSTGNLSGDVSTSGGTVTTLANSGVTAGNYTNANIAVDVKGRVIAASSGSGGGGGGGGSGALTYLGGATASSSATLDVIGLISSGYEI